MDEISNAIVELTETLKTIVSEPEGAKLNVFHEIVNYLGEIDKRLRNIDLSLTSLVEKNDSKG